MVNPFDRFYDTELPVYEKSGGGYDSEGENTLLGTVVCDVWPIDGDTESKMYSLSEKKSYKLFCNVNDLIKTGRYIVFGGAEYMIVRCDKLRLGMNAVMRCTQEAM